MAFPVFHTEGATVLQLSAHTEGIMTLQLSFAEKLLRRALSFCPSEHLVFRDRKLVCN